jgi:hypothetical protein
MALQKRERTMLLVLGGVVVAAGLFQLLSGGKSKPAVKNVKNLVEKTATQLGALKAAPPKSAGSYRYENEADSIRLNTWGARDPFSKPVPVLQAEAAASGPSIVVKGIIWMQGKPYVLINDVVLTVGEEKKGIRIDKIVGRKVYCRKGGESFILQWSKSP